MKILKYAFKYLNGYVIMLLLVDAINISYSISTNNKTDLYKGHYWPEIQQVA